MWFAFFRYSVLGALAAAIGIYLAHRAGTPLRAAAVAAASGCLFGFFLGYYSTQRTVDLLAMGGVTGGLAGLLAVPRRGRLPVVLSGCLMGMAGGGPVGTIGGLAVGLLATRWYSNPTDGV